MAIKASIVLSWLLLIGWCQGASQISRGYSFSYNADGSSRNEVADDLGRVQGSYTYTDDAGLERRVNYLASDTTGFEAEGDGILNVPRLIEETRARQAIDGVYEPTDEELASWATADRSYSLSYHAGDSARSEISRADGYVVGSYSYLDQDGIERMVEYEAGPGIGFRVKGEHIHSNIASDTVPSQFERPSLQLSEYTLRSGQVDYEPSDIRKEYNADGSITYSYQALDHSRSETVGPYGEVRGTYSYIGQDGQTHTVEYAGGSGIGFLASGNHISSNVGRLSASALEGLTRTNTRVTGSGVPTRGGHFGVSRTGGSRTDTTRSETITGVQDGHFGILRPGVSRVDTTRTETVTQVRGGAGSDRRFGVSGTGGSRIDTTRTETATGVTGGTASNRRFGVSESGGSRIDATRSETVTGVRGGITSDRRFGALGTDGSRVETTRSETVTGVLSGTANDRRFGVRGTGGSRIDATRTESVTGVGSGIAADRQFGVSGTGGSRIDTTRTETVTQVGGEAITGGSLGVLGSGGSRIGTTHTETITGVRGIGAATGVRGGVGGTLGGGGQIQTTHTERVVGQPLFGPSIVEEDRDSEGRRVVITTTTTENRRGGVGGGGVQRVVGGIRRFGTGQQVLVNPATGFGGESSGRRIVTTETRRIVPRPIVSGAAGLGGETRTTVQRTTTLSGNQLSEQIGSSGPGGPHFIKFSTPDGGDHELNLDTFGN